MNTNEIKQKAREMFDNKCKEHFNAGGISLEVIKEKILDSIIDLALENRNREVVEIIERYYPEVKMVSNSLTDEIVIFKIYKDIINLINNK